MTKEDIINFLDFKISIKFKKRVKNIRLRIDRYGQISISMPLYSTKNTALNFLNTNKDWLIKTHKKISSNLIKDNETRLLGKIYNLKFDENLKVVDVINNEIYAPNLKEFEKFKKNEAKKIFTIFIDKFSPFINKAINRIVIRKMQTRWGSCNSKKGYINLNLNLIEQDLKLIEYVVLHELTHLIYPHHKKDFYSYIENLIPDYREREKLLNRSFI